jgi:4-hydroxy-tetrahydrodipicolinate synthase
MVDFYLAAGVHGLTVLGVLGEAPKLSPDEAAEVVARVTARVAGRLPVVVGVSSPGTASLVGRARMAMAAGAAGVMIAPLPGLRTDEDLVGYYVDVFVALGPDVPVCYQDLPATGVMTSVAVLGRLVDRYPQLVVLKHEDYPGLRKISRLRAEAAAAGRRRIAILAGNGALHLPQELRRGADGAMTGFGYPEMLVEVCARFARGDAEAAEDLFDRYLPLVRHEAQPGIGLAIRKEILRRRGAISCAATRAPGPRLDADDRRELDGLMARLERALAR